MRILAQPITVVSVVIASHHCEIGRRELTRFVSKGALDQSK